MCNAIKEKRRRKLSLEVLFHNENASVHRVEVALEAFRNAGFDIFDHPIYAPHLALSDFHLFPKLKEYFRRKNFDDDGAIVAAVEHFSKLNFFHKD